VAAEGARSWAAPDASTRSDDLQSLLADALRRLRASSGCQRAWAWLRRPDGGVRVVAADGDAAGRSAPDPGTTEHGAGARLAVWKLEGSFDCGARGVDEAVRELAERSGISAGRVLRTRSGEPVAVLWVGGDEDPPGAVRPRVLAALEGCAEGLDVPLAGLAAAARLEHLDAEVQRLQRLASLGDLLSEVVHEVRNPLVSVKTFLQLLPGRENDPELTGEFRQVAVEEVQRLERLLDALAHHGRPRSRADARGTCVEGCLESIAGLLRHRALDREVELRAEPEPGLPPVALHEDALRQVLLNLAVNAVEATRSGGWVVLGARAGETGVELRVDDQGPGIPEPWRQRVFEPFFSTRSERAGGLGLAITRRLVEEAGGRVAVETAPGGGARFRVDLPAALPPDAEPRPERTD